MKAVCLRKQHVHVCAQKLQKIDSSISSVFLVDSGTPQLSDSVAGCIRRVYISCRLPVRLAVELHAHLRGDLFVLFGLN